MGGKGRRGRKSALDMLDRSHRKLEEHLELLRNAAARIASGVASPTDIEAVGDVVSFFERSIARHEADEEQSLFPRLRGRAGIDGVLDRLGREHREHTRLMARLQRLHSVLGRRPSRGDGAALVRLSEKLVDSYSRHIELEDDELFPTALSVLSPDELADIADEMQTRRGRR